MKLKFTNFPYEVNMIQWNKMNDLFSGFSLSDLIMNYNIATKCVPFSGNSSDGFSSSEEHWALNVFTHNASFSKKDIPWQDGKTLNGLTSFEINEGYDAKIGLGRFTFIDLGKKELSNKCRTFIKAGWNGDEENPNITDSDDSNWSFKVKFTLPEIRMTGYACNFVNGNVKLGQPDNYIYKGEKVVHALRGYISAHAGAVEPTYDPADIDGFHFEYFADDNQMTIVQNTGLIKEAKVAGDIPVTVVLMRGPKREVCRYVQKIRVYEKVINATSPEICIGFVDGKKGYDLTLTEKNAQIKGFITKYGKDQNNNDVIINPIENAGGYHFEYSESSNGKIITIDPITGNITPKAEGDVTITAVLKDGNTVISNPYSYTLHVFAQHEGLEFRRINTYQYTTNSDKDNWKISDNQTNHSNNEWKPNNLLRVNTSMENVTNAGQNDWKQIASYSVNSSNNWRAICQEIAFDLYVPKYTTATATYTMAGNAAIGNKNNGNCRYGFELFYVNQGNNNVDLETATKWLRNRTWDTKTNGTITNSSVTARWGTDSYHSSIGDYGYYVRSTNNVDAEDSYDHKKYTVYFAAMTYLWKDHSYPGNVSIGFKGIPTYTYYTKVTYAKNDGTGTIVRPEPEKWVTTTSKTETFKLFQGASNSEKAQLSSRAGYTFLGWSTDPNATTPEYELEDDFPIYDNVNGGGMGPVTLYAVWKPNKYIVELRHVADGRIDDYVEATYDQAMPSVNVNGTPIVAPVHRGYDFKGYYAEGIGSGTKYYNEDLSSNHIWDRTEKNYVVASWAAHKSTVVFDPQGGNNYGATRVTATYDAAMPTEGVQAPQRQGYTFGGYYSKANGQGTQYYTANMTSARTWNIDERLLDPQVTEVTLYAKWIGNTYTVTLDPQGGTGGSTSVTATYGQKLPSGLIAPTKPGYEFRGYYGIKNDEWAESQGQDIYYGGKEYYDKDMNGVEPWDKTQAATIYAHWAPATYIVTFDANGGVLPNNVIDKNKQNFDIAEGSNGVITITYKYKTGNSNTLVHAEAKKPGYELLGWFVGDVKVIDASETSRNCVITDNGGYWTENGLKYNHAGDLTLTAQYRKKYKYADNVITFGKDENGNPEKVEPDEDWLYSVVNDLVGAAKDVYDNEPGHPQTMVFDLRESINRWTDGNYNCQKVMEDLQKPENAEFISPNLLVYFNADSYNYEKGKSYNAVTVDNKCEDLRVTDRYSIKIPVTFNAANATYERDAKVASDDAAKDQAKNSTWGTICLPYPIQNNTNGVKFYELQSTANNYMEFEEMAQDEVIPANTPVLYIRADGGVSSMITIKEQNVGVPMNANYTAVNKSYSNADESIRDWEFRGNLKTTVFYGKGYVNPPAGAQILDGDVYYFKQDKFTYLNPKMEKNGKTYQAAKMTLYPYRAYFYRNTKGSYYSSAKVSEYSILVIGEDGATLDITNEIFGDGEGDGKIYDLNGIRVMKPVKGRLYIVNGQKKVYK